jgi:nitrous oxidase accessory protein NosD
MRRSIARAGNLTAFLATVALPAGVPLRAQRTVPFEPGMVVTESVRIEPATYAAAGPPTLDEALLIVRGDDLTLDLRGVSLVGTPSDPDPDQARGIAILVEGGTDVTITGGTIRGYRFAVVARGTRNLTLTDIDVSYNWKPRLFSLVGHESLVDWMSFHDNENREWMRFGAAVYLEDVTGGEIRGLRAVQGMNGLLMVRTDSLWIQDNEIAFNSALGIGMYRSSRNTIVRNRMDYNVRGYSQGFYNRGQDSAGILLYEQSSNNVIAYNSVTHGGDGLFLWAGGSTMETGRGGANENLIFGNDFSYAPTNSIEVTFSRNRIVANRAVGSRYGVWGGYSWETLIAGNCFGGNETGVAIEHGQENVIESNWFSGDETGIQLWARASEPADWGYPKHRDTRSRDNRVTDNVMGGHDQVWKLDRTTGLDITGNRVDAEAPVGTCDPRTLLGERYDFLAPELPGVPPEVPEVEVAAWDRSAIVVDEWGPYDWRFPKLWPVDTARAEVRLRVMGPTGAWRLVERRGVVRVSAETGVTGDTLIVTPSEPGDWSIRLEYTGGATVSPRGDERPAAEPVPFSFERFEPEVEWDVRFFTWTDEASDPPTDATAFTRMLEGEPLLTRAESRLDHMWYVPVIGPLPQERWALVATGSVDLPEGEYSLRTISDDGVRVWVDGELVIDHWEPHGSRVDYAVIPPGRHDLRVQYYQLGGWSELRVEIVKGSPRSVGSAGPH